MPDELLRFDVPGSTDVGTTADRLAEFRAWRAERQAWLDAHAPGATYRDVEAERARRRPVVDRAPAHVQDAVVTHCKTHTQEGSDHAST